MSRLLCLAGLVLLCSLSLASRCGKHNCISGQSECISGQCVCQSPYTKGLGNFGCYKKNAVAAEIKNDPMLTNFNNQTLPFPFPCRYLVTHVRQELKDRNRDVIGSCEFKIYAFNAKHKGKFFNYGFDVAAKVNYNDGREVKLSSRNWGYAEDGDYKFWKKGIQGEFLENGNNGVWGNDNIYYRDRPNDIKIQVKQIDANNQLAYEFKKCGLRITFVPYDIIKRRAQVEIPGMAIAINCAMHPQWLSNGDVMATAPTMDNGHLFEEYDLPGLTTEQSILNRAFTRGFEQNQPADDDSQCQAVSNVLNKCNDQTRAMAFDRCYWIMKQPRFVRCADKTRGAQKVLELFHMCVDVFCGSRPCQDVINAVARSGCSNTRRIDELPPFMAGAMCP